MQTTVIIASVLLSASVLGKPADLEARLTGLETRFEAVKKVLDTKLEAELASLNTQQQEEELRRELEAVRGEVERLREDRGEKANQDTVREWLEETVLELRREVRELEIRLEAGAQRGRLEAVEGREERLEQRQEEIQMEMKQIKETTEDGVLRRGKSFRLSPPAPTKAHLQNKGKKHLSKKYLANWIKEADIRFSEVAQEIQGIQERLGDCNKYSQDKLEEDRRGKLEGEEMEWRGRVEKEETGLRERLEEMVFTINTATEELQAVHNHQTELERRFDLITSSFESSLKELQVKLAKSLAKQI